MIGRIVRQEIARTNRNLLVSNIVVLVLIPLYFLWSGAVSHQNPFFITPHASVSTPNEPEIGPADFSHPTPITVHDLDSENRLKQLEGRAAQLTDSETEDLKFPVWDSTSRGASADPSLQPKYRFSRRGSRLFVILPPDSHTTGPTFTGILRPLAQMDSDQVTVVLHSRGVQNFTLIPYMLDGLSHRSRGPFARPFAAPSLTFPLPNLFLILLCALPLWNIAKAVLRGQRPETHPLARSLEQYGPLADVAKAIDQDWAAGVTRIAPAQFMSHWLLVQTIYSTIAVPLDAVVWIYERTYYTRGRTFAICIRDWQGRYIEFICGMFQVQKIIEQVTRVRPWIISGYSSQAASDFASNRAQFLAEVNRRRQQYTAANSPTPPYTP